MALNENLKVYYLYDTSLAAILCRKKGVAADCPIGTTATDS